MVDHSGVAAIWTFWIYNSIERIHLNHTTTTLYLGLYAINSRCLTRNNHLIVTCGYDCYL